MNVGLDTQAGGCKILSAQVRSIQPFPLRRLLYLLQTVAASDSLKAGENLTEEAKPLSQVIPRLVAVLVCDVAVADPNTGKKSLIGIFDLVTVGRFPTQRPMSVYMKLADAEGLYRIQVRFVHVGPAKVLARYEGEVEVNSRLHSCDLFLSAPPLPIPAEGRYEFQVWANDVFLGGTFIDAISARPDAGGGKP